MKIVETFGCTSADFTVEGKSLHKLSSSQYDAVINKVLLEIRTGLDDHTVMLHEVMACLQYDSCVWNDVPCDTCGDTTTTTTWVL
jgi:hypothetical protein